MIREHVKELDSLRGLAALMVMLFHYTTQYEKGIGHIGKYVIYVPWGYMGVCIFFVLSGFLTIMNLGDKDTLFKFAYKRAIRLYPTYWVSILLTTIAMLFLLPNRVRPLLTIFANFTMLQGYLGFDAVDGVYWTLGIEIMFYAIVGLLLHFKRINKILGICTGWVLISGVISILKLFFDAKVLKLLSLLLISPYSQMFIAGIVLYKLSEARNKVLPYVILVLSVINQFITQGVAYSIFFIAVIIVIYLIVSKKISFSCSSLEFICKISYPLYLTHQFIGFGIIKHMEGYGLTNEIFIIIPICFAILLAFVLHKHVEEPSAKFLRKLITSQNSINVKAVKG